MSKLLHYTFDAILITTVLAGIKRSTGLQYCITDYIINEILIFILLIDQPLRKSRAVQFEATLINTSDSVNGYLI